MPEKTTFQPPESVGQVPAHRAPRMPARAGVWWRTGDAAVLLAYSTVVIFAVGHHEKWADEAQAWLLARDLSLKTLWLHELRYEGSPGLWHTILWIAQHWFGVGYAAFGYIGAVCAIAGTAWLIFRAPFPRPLRWLAAFSYFFVYQYAVVARSYVLFALFALIVAECFRDRNRPGRFALSLAPLALLTAHGSLLAFALGLTYAFRFAATWREHDERTRRAFLYALAGITLLFAFLFAILLPARDTEATHNAALTASVIATRTLEGLSGALVDNRWLSLLICCAFAAWCYTRRALTSFLLPVVLLTALYVYAAGWPHQQGTVFLAIFMGLVIAWPRDGELRTFTKEQRWSYRGVTALLAATLAWQAYVGFVIIRNDARLPYSGAEDMASYLNSAVNAHKTIYGYQYGMVAVNAYFDRNIFANWKTAYYHHAVGAFDPRKIGPEIVAGRPDYVVTTWWEPFDPAAFRAKQLLPMQALGYSLAHMSDGYLLTKTGSSQRQIYAAFVRNGSGTNENATPAR